MKYKYYLLKNVYGYVPQVIRVHNGKTEIKVLEESNPEYIKGWFSIDNLCDYRINKAKPITKEQLFLILLA